MRTITFGELNIPSGGNVHVNYPGLTSGMDIPRAQRAKGRPNGDPGKSKLCHNATLGCLDVLGVTNLDIQDLEVKILADKTVIQAKLKGNNIAVAMLDKGQGNIRFCGGFFAQPQMNREAFMFLSMFTILYRNSYSDFVDALEAAALNSTDKAVIALSDELRFLTEKIIRPEPGNEDPLGLRALYTDTSLPKEMNQLISDPDQTKILTDWFTSHVVMQQAAVIAIPTTYASINDYLEQTWKDKIDSDILGKLPLQLAKAFHGGQHVLLTGPTATAKTSAVVEVCWKLGIPLIQLNGNDGKEDRDLYGVTQLKAVYDADGKPVTNQTEFAEGPLRRIFRLANTQYELYEQEQATAAAENREPVWIPPAVLSINEINRFQTRHQNIFLEVMDVHQDTGCYHLDIPETGETVTCPVKFLCLVASRNVGMNYVGISEMDAALVRRFHVKITTQYLDFPDELDLLCRRTNLSRPLAAVLVKVANDSRSQMSQLKMPIDTDTLIKWGDEVQSIVKVGVAASQDLLHETAEYILEGIILPTDEFTGRPVTEIKRVLYDSINEAYSNQTGAPI